MDFINNFLKRFSYDYCKDCNQEMEERTKSLYALPMNRATDGNFDTKIDYFAKNAIAINDTYQIPSGYNGAYVKLYQCGSCGKQVECLEIFSNSSSNSSKTIVKLEPGSIRELQSKILTNEYLEEEAVYTPLTSDPAQKIQDYKNNNIPKQTNPAKKVRTFIFIVFLMTFFAPITSLITNIVVFDEIKNQLLEEEKNAQQYYIEDENNSNSDDINTNKLYKSCFYSTRSGAFISLEDERHYRYYGFIGNLEDNYYEGTYDIYRGDEAIKQFLSMSEFGITQTELESYVEYSIENGYIVGLHEMSSEQIYEFDENGEIVGINSYIPRYEVTKDDLYLLTCRPQTLIKDGMLYSPSQLTFTYIGFYIEDRNGIEFTYCEGDEVVFWEFLY